MNRIAMDDVPSSRKPTTVNGDIEMPFENIGWIGEARIRDGKREEFEQVTKAIVAETTSETGTLNYQYYVSDGGDVFVYERFADLPSAHKHIDTWEKHVDRWVAAAEPTRMVHLGNLPEALRKRHAELTPLLLKPVAGFPR